MLDANDGGATVTALPIATNVDAAWARYATLIGKSMADPQLLVDREYSTACVRAWATFRDLLIAHDTIAAETVGGPANGNTPELATGKPRRA